jgi:hypothetical protein
MSDSLASGFITININPYLPVLLYDPEWAIEDSGFPLASGEEGWGENVPSFPDTRSTLALASL